MERVTNGEAILKTVSSNLNGLLNYAKFLESRRLQWFEFPSRKADRCLVQCLGALIKARDAGHRPPGYARGVICELPYPTDDTRVITKAAVATLSELFLEGFKFSKAEIPLMDLR